MARRSVAVVLVPEHRLGAVRLLVDGLVPVEPDIRPDEVVAKVGEQRGPQIAQGRERRTRCGAMERVSTPARLKRPSGRSARKPRPPPRRTAFSASRRARVAASKRVGTTVKPSSSNSATCSVVSVVKGPSWSCQVKPWFHGWVLRSTTSRVSPDIGATVPRSRDACWRDSSRLRWAHVRVGAAAVEVERGVRGRQQQYAGNDAGEPGDLGGRSAGGRDRQAGDTGHSGSRCPAGG